MTTLSGQPTAGTTSTAVTRRSGLPSRPAGKARPGARRRDAGGARGWTRTCLRRIGRVLVQHAKPDVTAGTRCSRDGPARLLMHDIHLTGQLFPLKTHAQMNNRSGPRGGPGSLTSNTALSRPSAHLLAQREDSNGDVRESAVHQRGMPTSKKAGTYGPEDEERSRTGGVESIESATPAGVAAAVDAKVG